MSSAQFPLVKIREIREIRASFLPPGGRGPLRLYASAYILSSAFMSSGGRWNAFGRVVAFIIPKGVLRSRLRAPA